jgi:hypothetical protein
MELQKVPEEKPVIKSWMIKSCIVMAWINVILGFLLLFLGATTAALIQFGWAAWTWLNAWVYIKINEKFNNNR